MDIPFVVKDLALDDAALADAVWRIQLLAHQVEVK